MTVNMIPLVHDARTWAPQEPDHAETHPDGLSDWQCKLLAEAEQKATEE